MAISLSRYVDITSGVGAGNVVPTRDLVGRLFTGSNLLPPQSFISFTNAGEAAVYFGDTSEEFYRAEFYFNWVSKNLTQPQSIQFARWVQTSVAPLIFPLIGNGSALGNWTTISSGSFILTMGASTFSVNGMDFTGAGSLAAVATIIQDAIQAQVAGGSLWTAATVTYFSAYGGFLLAGGTAGDAALSVAVGGGGTDITPRGLLGWIPEGSDINGNFIPGAIWAQGSNAETITQTLTTSANISNNFGSFLFLTNLNVTGQDVIDAANWNNSQNVLYMYTQSIDPSSAADASADLANIGGVGLTLSPTYSPLQYPEQMPMMIEAATNYYAFNSVQNYEFQQFPGITPSVTSDSDADVYDNLRINYYGATQTAGQQISFYQTGVLFGLPPDILDMNAYVNEIWLKDAAGAALMTLLLSQSQVPANAQGRNQILNTLQGVINQALDNGTISVGKTLTTNQQVYITSATGDPLAWYQVQNSGYWVDVVITSSGNPPTYTATYTLIYSKDDVIRKIIGTHTLI